MDKIKVLQVGQKNWNEQYTIPDFVSLDYCETLDEEAECLYDVVFIDGILMDKEVFVLQQSVKAYTLFFTDTLLMTEQMTRLYTCKKGQLISESDIQGFLDSEVEFYFSKPYGEKNEMSMLTVSQYFKGTIQWNGNCSLCLNGEFGDDFRQIAYWRNNIQMYKGQTIDLWLEYKKDDSVEISLEVVLFERGNLGEIKKTWEFSQEKLKNIVNINDKEIDGRAFVYVKAKGKGKLQIISLHKRNSRKKHGFFLPGGQRYVTSEREEVFSYFDPGDMRPPLNVYFAGYRTKEGFEGYSMMRKMGSPFLLISETRLEGGGFYRGTPEFENIITACIRKHMEELQFTQNQVILSGLSMGTYGALYYGCDIRPHAIILGKPLANIGDIARNEKRTRPGGFPTSLDILLANEKALDDDAINRMNQYFWKKFIKVDWGNTKFIVAYMIEDDYDKNAYQQMLEHIQSGGVQVYGKGIHGRHNDASGAIVNWFIGQYEKVLNEDYSRRISR